MIKKSKPLNLFRLIDDALADVHDVTKVRRLIPLAWPVMEIEHSLKIRIEEELGVVERHVLEAIARFGPIPGEEVAELMGLDAAIVAAVEKTLKRFDSVLTHGPQGISASPDTLKRIAAGGWSREVVQPYGFLVNGPSGMLAPKELGQIRSNHQLSLDLSVGQGVVKDISGRELYEVFWIGPSRSDGRADLARLLSESDTETMGSFGIPEGAMAVESQAGKLLSKRWQLAMGELLEDGTLTIRSASHPDIILLTVRSDQRQNLAELLRSGSRDGYDVLRQDDGKNSGQGVPKTWEPHAVCEAGDGKLVITMRHSDAIKIWADAEDDAELDDFINETGSISPKTTTSVPKSLLIALGKTYLWNPSSFAVRAIFPGDVTTAGLILRIQGIEGLRKLASDPPVSFDFLAWWAARQEAISASWTASCKTIRVPLDDLLALARRSPDGDLVEFVSEIS